MDHDFFGGRFSGKFLGATEHLKRWSCFSGRNVSKNGNSYSNSSKISGTRFRPSWLFFCQWYSFVQGPVFCLPFIIFHVNHNAPCLLPPPPPPPSRPKRNRRQWFYKYIYIYFGGGGGGGVNKVHYGLCENSEFAQSVNLPIVPCK